MMQFGGSREQLPGTPGQGREHQGASGRERSQFNSPRIQEWLGTLEQPLPGDDARHLALGHKLRDLARRPSVTEEERLMREEVTQEYRQVDNRLDNRFLGETLPRQVARALLDTELLVAAQTRFNEDLFQEQMKEGSVADYPGVQVTRDTSVSESLIERVQAAIQAGNFNAIALALRAQIEIGEAELSALHKRGQTVEGQPGRERIIDDLKRRTVNELGSAHHTHEILIKRHLAFDKTEDGRPVTWEDVTNGTDTHAPEESI